MQAGFFGFSESMSAHFVKMQTMEEGEEEDVVVREIDVYVCNDPVGAQLCLLSHPLRPPWRPYDYERVSTVRMKPAAKRLEVDVPIDTESPNYSKGDDDVGSGYKQINKLTLRSQLVEAKSSMAMGTIQDGKLLLAPIDLCLQLRPNLAHLNVSRKGGGEGGYGGEDGMDEDEEEQPAMKAVEVQVQKRETERQQQARLNSYAYISQKEEEEPWKELKVYGDGSTPADKVWSRLMTPAEKSEPHKHLSRQQYLYSFIPSTSLVATEAGIGQRGAPGAHGLGQVTLDGNTSSQPQDTQVSAEAKAAFPGAMRALFARHTVCTMGNVRQWLLEPKSGAGAAKAAATLTDKALDDMVMSAGLPVVKIQRVYVLRQLGKPDIDPFRAIVVDLLKDKQTFKRSEVTELANQQGQPVTDTLYNKVVKDLCTSKGQLWTLKNGADM